MFCLFFVLSVIFTSVAAICKPGEYEIGGICCPMCNAGSVVRIHCTPTSPSIVCIPCVDGTYIDHPNGLTKCLKCTECDTGAGLREVKKCNYNSNTECDCKPDYYCPSNERPCDLCSPHTICRPGQYVKEQGTSTSDNVCKICPAESFSTSNMSQTCTPWTKCSEQNRVQTKQGTETTDSVCIDRRHRYGLKSLIGLIGTCICIFFFKWLWKRIRDKSDHSTPAENIVIGLPLQKDEENTLRRNGESENSAKLPVEETRPIDG